MDDQEWHLPFVRGYVDMDCSSISSLSSVEYLSPLLSPWPDNAEGPKAILDDSDSSALSSPRSLSPSPPTSPACSEDIKAIWGNRRDSEPPISSLLTRRLGEAKNLTIELPVRPKAVPKSSSQTQEILEVVRLKQNSFFLYHKDTILPLLPEQSSLLNSIETAKLSEEISIQPYRALNHQPAGMKAELKSHQLEGLSFLIHLMNNGMGGILGDEMGLGKTIQTLSLFQHIRQDSSPQSDIQSPFLVICPLSVADNWVAEVRKFTPGLHVLKFHGSQSERAKIKEYIAGKKSGKPRFRCEPMADIIITTYDTLLNDKVWFARAFVWKYIVLDEGHRIKNSESKRSRALHMLKSEFKLVLTGTPIQNDLRELWSIFHWLYPTLFASKTSELFQEAFSLGEGRVDRIFLEQVKKFLALVMIRREKESPGIGIEIPKKTEITLSVPLSSIQHSLYLGILTGSNHLLSHEHNSSVPVSQNRSIGNILMELRKCSIHPFMLDEGVPESFRLDKNIISGSGKFVVLCKLIEQFVVKEEKKIIIFSGFESALDICEELLTMNQPNGPNFEYVRLDGRTSSSWRKLNVFLFNNDTRYKVFLVSTRAGGEGLNLTSASTVVFLDEDWNPQVTRQAEARVHRLGQSRPVTIFKIRSLGTVEDQMSRRIDKKLYLANKVTDNVKTPGYIDSPLSNSGFRDTNFTSSSTALESNLVATLHRAAVSETQIDTNSLASLDWHTLVQKCVENQPDPRDIENATFTERDEQAWLDRVERVQTDIFHGLKVDTTSRFRQPTQQHILEELARADRRIGKKRTITIDGFEVLKSCLDTFPDEESTIKNELKEEEAKNEVVHEVTCFVCRGLDSVDCRICPRSFHQECLDKVVEFQPNQALGFSCPHHNCCNCHRPASQVGQLLFACTLCEKAYCEKCLEWENTKFIGRNLAYEAMGYEPRNAFYIHCEGCINTVKRKIDNEGDEIRPVKRCKTLMS